MPAADSATKDSHRGEKREREAGGGGKKRKKEEEEEEKSEGITAEDISMRAHCQRR